MAKPPIRLAAPQRATFPLSASRAGGKGNGFDVKSGHHQHVARLSKPPRRRAQLLQQSLQLPPLRRAQRCGHPRLVLPRQSLDLAVDAEAGLGQMQVPRAAVAFDNALFDAPRP